MLAKINNLKNWQVAVIIAVIGFAVFFSGLTSPFQGDDITQITQSTPVHSISNINTFFEGGTFYAGNGTRLIGDYYRPIMISVFSLIYSVFGPHALYFHLFQLIVYIGSAILLYLVFRYTFNTVLSLVLSLVFLVHPLNSQVVYAIPSMQDVLFFFFSILALYLLLRFKSIRSLILVALCLLLAMLSKEMGMASVLLVLIYLFWWSRKRLLPFIGIMTVPTILYLVLKIKAVGLDINPRIAPIDNLSLATRLLTAPSIVQFYISKFLFPWKLATQYYWVYPTFSVRHVLIPLIIDIIVIGIFVYLGRQIHKKLDKAQYYTYLFFSAWAAIGLIPYLQITPLDMTACETWFYFSMAGVLGMVGIILVMYQRYFKPELFIVVVVILVSALGIRTFSRGFDWRNTHTLDLLNVSASNQDYASEANLSSYYLERGDYNKAVVYARQSVNYFPTAVSYNALGQAYVAAGNYPAAYQALTIGMRVGTYYPLYESLGALDTFYGNPNANKQFLTYAVDKFPQDTYLWFYLAIVEYKTMDNSVAKYAITKAVEYSGDNNETYNDVYYKIMNNLPLNLTFKP